MFRKLVKTWIPLSLSALTLGACSPSASTSNERYVIFYGAEATPEQTSRYDLLVFQPDNHPSLESLAPRQIALAYVSIGEAYKGILPKDKRHVVIREHDYWNSELVDVRENDWQDFVIQQLVTPAMTKGFDGVMLDTVDSAIHLERSDPENFAGMTDAAVKLIAAIRQNHPNSLIMLNRGFDIWPNAAPHIDMLLAESTLSHYDLKANKGQIASAEHYEQQMQKIHAIKTSHPHLRVYSVDYWDMNDKEGVLLLYRRQRASGLVPYVSTPALDTIYPEPEQQPLPWGGLPALMTGDRDA